MTPALLTFAQDPVPGHSRFAHLEGGLLTRRSTVDPSPQWSVRTIVDAWGDLAGFEDAQSAETIIATYRSRLLRQRSREAADRWDRNHGEVPTIGLSQATLGIVRDGFVHVAALSERFAATPTPVGRINDEHVERFVNDQLRKAFSAAADVFAAYGIQERVVGRADGLTDEFDVMIQERVPVRPKDFARLSASLEVDMAGHLQRGGTYVRPWGRLKLDAGTLVMVIEVRAPARVNRGRRAKLVE